MPTDPWRNTQADLCLDCGARIGDRTIHDLMHDETISAADLSVDVVPTYPATE